VRGEIVVSDATIVAQSVPNIAQDIVHSPHQVTNPQSLQPFYSALQVQSVVTGEHAKLLTAKLAEADRTIGLQRLGER